MAVVYVDHSLDTKGPWKLTPWHPTPGQQIAICDRCAIMLGHPMALKNESGDLITVGADCAEALINVDVDSVRRRQELARLQSAQRAHAKQVRDARDERKRSELDTIMADPDKIAALKSKPHPTSFRAAQGETLYTWAEWMIQHSGAAGRSKTLKAIKIALTANPHMK